VLRIGRQKGFGLGRQYPKEAPRDAPGKGMAQTYTPWTEKEIAVLKAHLESPPKQRWGSIKRLTRQLNRPYWSVFSKLQELKNPNPPSPNPRPYARRQRRSSNSFLCWDPAPAGSFTELARRIYGEPKL
jgi:hypothetical protein